MHLCAIYTMFEVSQELDGSLSGVFLFQFYSKQQKYGSCCSVDDSHRIPLDCPTGILH